MSKIVDYWIEFRFDTLLAYEKYICYNTRKIPPDVEVIMSEKKKAAQRTPKERSKFAEAMCAVGRFLKEHWRWSLELRKVILAFPVVAAMLYLAEECRKRLPDLVGVNLLTNGQFEKLVQRETAIDVMMGITILCLICMAISRKTIYPWLISIFSLLLPILLMVTNMLPA